MTRMKIRLSRPSHVTKGMRPCRRHHCADHEGRERECEQWEFRDALEDQKFQSPRQNRRDPRRKKRCDGEALRIRTYGALPDHKGDQRQRDLG